MTSIWFAQIVGFEFRLIDFYESRGHALKHYLDMLEERAKPGPDGAPGYTYGEHWLRTTPGTSCSPRSEHRTAICGRRAILSDRPAPDRRRRHRCRPAGLRPVLVR